MSESENGCEAICYCRTYLWASEDTRADQLPGREAKCGNRESLLMDVGTRHRLLCVYKESLCHRCYLNNFGVSALADNMNKYRWRDFINWGTANFEVKYEQETPISDPWLIAADWKSVQINSNQSTDSPTPPMFSIYAYFNLFPESHVYTSWNKYNIPLVAVGNWLQELAGKSLT